jgi:hypothetical protein
MATRHVTFFGFIAEVKRRAVRWLLAVVRVSWYAPLLLACSRLSEADLQHLRLLEQRYGERFEFALEGDLYLKARLRDPKEATDTELRDIYRLFVLDQQGRRRDTPVVYLNAYNSGGDFQTQLTYDFSTNRSIHGKTEHY